ncbi:MAG: xanthan lyase [Verrucomicrobia bacterium]|nr:MAG: xanthan lyase [Verrucomicrobiota bacterium]
MPLVLFGGSLLGSQNCPVVETDICVYGGTSGGVAAAVAAARLGKSVALVVVNNHVGGMSSGGLGVTDKGNASSIGGVAAEFYSRVGQAYGSSVPVYYFEPHVAEQTFRAMLSGAGVPVYTNQRLASVTLSNLTLTQIVMEDGTIYRAKEFIDTTYEGDLMAMAGVSFAYGRESSSTYGESYAGVQNPGGSYNYDPYVVPGNPASGLLPFVQPGSPGTPGQADDRLQTYNYRLCLTQNPTNQIPIAPPANYSEAQYELFRRYLAARVAQDGSVALNQIIDIQTIIPNGKTDINANGELSTDYLGGNYGYATNTYAGREVIRQAHEDYIRGYLYFLATSTNVPSSVRTQMQSWALAKDEFQDTGGWPHQMYVREARRMVSGYVMAQQDCVGSRAASDPIALASYGMDCHPVERIASGGYARPEGGLGGNVAYPYGISYRSIIPRVGQCPNLFCTFALSASHVAFASIRMEPVLMMTSQSAATAAAFAIDDDVPVQQVNYAKLAAELRADRQLLAWACASEYLTNNIILDQGNSCYVTAVGTWTPGANTGGWNGDYWHDGASGKGSKSVTYKPNLPTNGTYDVYLWWVEASNRATNTPVDVVHAAGTTRVLVNQKINGSVWFKILRTNFNAGVTSSVIIRNDGTLSGAYCIADGVRWAPVGFNLPAPPATPPPTVEIVAGDAVAGEFGTNNGRFTIVRNNDPTLLALTVNYSISGTASNGVDYALLSGSATLAAGALATNVIVSPLGGNLAADQETVTLTLLPSTNFSLTTLSNATVSLLDRPLNAWRRANFTPAELGDPTVSGDLADPDHDGLSNLEEYSLGLPPKDPNPANRPSARIENGHLTFTYTRSKAAADVALTFEVSSDLVSWQPASGYTEQSNCVDEDTVQRITVRLLAPVSATNSAFLRLTVAR